jgi:hypothetical protein
MMEKSPVLTQAATLGSEMAQFDVGDASSRRD